MTSLAGLALLPALFAFQSGWYVGHQPVRACPGTTAGRCEQAGSWAATIQWRRCGACLPHQMVAALPPDGIVLQVDVAIERPLMVRRVGVWPPTIRARNIGGIEGIPARDGVDQLVVRVGRIEAYVWAFFGRAHPTPLQLAAANAELTTIRLDR